ncbi:hypothetical protein [Nostoc sp.]
MTLEFKHFDTRLNQWIYPDTNNKNPESILAEKLDNTLLESYFPEKKFSFGHIDEYSKSEDLKNHPDGHVLLLSSKTRLLYGPPECLEVIEKLCPDRKDRGAYGSIFLGSCRNAISEKLNILVVDDSTDAKGKNGGILENEVAWKLVGDCYGQISTELYDKLTKREEQSDKNYRVIQHRFGWKEGDGEDTEYRFGKGTLRPYDLKEIKYANANNTPKIDLIIPISSFKGTDKDKPGGPSKPQIEPGLYQQTIWLGEKAQSQKGKTAISQLLASFPQGIKDFAEELEAQAQKLAEAQDDPRIVAQLYCENYEKRKEFSEQQKKSLEQEIIESVKTDTLSKQVENNSDEDLELNDESDESQKDDMFMYKLIKADLLGQEQLLETEKVKQELSRFVQGQWRDIAVGKTLTFDRGMIIPSKELKNGEICVTWIDENEKVLNFRSPFLNSNGLCISNNKYVEDRLAPDGTDLQGIIVRETDKGPSAIVQTPQGAKLEITNLTRYGHPLIWKAQTLNIRLDEIPEKWRTKERPHKLLAVAQINGEKGSDKKPAYRNLGTVSQQSVTDHNLKAGMTIQGAKLLELKPELTRSQTKLLYALANEAALAFYASISESEKLAGAAAAWNICASRQDELEVARKENANPQARAKKVSNFAFAAFPNEIISRLDKLQFTEPKLVTLNNEANQFLGRDWNPTEKHPIEIRASYHPPGHERHVSRLLFVQDTDGEYKEFAMLETRTGMLPIGTKAQANFIGVEPATAKATIGLPGNEPIEITIRELRNFSYAGLVFNSEPVNLEFGTVPVPDKTVKIKIDALTLGELDSDSLLQLKQIDYLKNGNPLKLKLTSISETGDQAFVLGESPNGNLIKINKISFYDFSGQTFNDQDYRKLTIETSASKTRDAVFLNGETLGVLHFKKDKDALRQLGLLKTGQLTHADAIIQSNFSVICAQIDPNTVEYPQKWTKEFQAFGTQSVNPQQQEMIESSAKILHHIKERPTFLFSTESNKKLGVMGLAVDNQKAETVTKWLTAQNVKFSLAPTEDVIRETKKGLAVFNLVDSSIPAKTLESMAKKFGAVIETDSEYQQRVNSLATRPQFLKPPEQTAQSPPNQSTLLLSTTPSITDISNSTKTEPLGVEKPPTVTIDDLRNWYNAADKLGKSENYKKRIVEVANGFKAGEELSAEALTVMNQDTFELEAISRLTQIAQRIGMVGGKSDENGTQVLGKIYDLAFNTQQRDLTISQKNGEIILNLQSGKVQTNKVTPQILQTFEDANTQIDKILAKSQTQQVDLQR